jgi:hypothetical protein
MTYGPALSFPEGAGLVVSRIGGRALSMVERGRRERLVTNFSRRGEPAPPPKPPLSGYVGSDRHYRTGAGDPPLRSDPGAGPWNSKPKTAAAITQHAGLLALVMHGAPNVYPGINATRHLRHYLLNTGLPYTIDLEDMVRSVPSAGPWMVREFRQAQGFFKTLPVGRHRFTSIFAEGGSYNVQEENADWFFAVGGYARWGRGGRPFPTKK